MKFSTKIIVGLSIFGVLIGINYADNYFSQKKANKELKIAKALDFNGDDVVEISITNPNGTFVFQRIDKKSNWKMIQPISLEADQSALTNTINQLSSLKVQHIFSDNQDNSNLKQDLEKYDLAHPKTSIVVTLSDKSTQKISFGKEILFGDSKPVSIYAMSSMQHGMIVVEASTPEFLKERNFSYYRSKKLVHFKKNDVAKFTIHSKETNVELALQNDHWVISSNQNAQADKEFISSFLNTYLASESAKIIEKNEAAIQGLSKFDLAPPAAVVEFYNQSGGLLQKIPVGITKQGVYMLLSDGAVSQYELKLWPDYVPKAVKFENRLVLLGLDTNQISGLEFEKNIFYKQHENNWYAVEKMSENISETAKDNPQALSFFSNLQYMTAEDLIQNPAKSDLKKYGFDHPRHQFKLLFIDNDKQNSVSIFVGSSVLHNDKAVYVMRSDKNTIYIVNGNWLNSLEKIISKKS